MITRRQWTGAKQMNRREFLASTTIAGVTALLDGSDVFAQSKQDALLVISEGGPNNLDVQGVGANRPGYEVSWNCYDRLVSYGIKTLADGSRSYDQTTIVPELAERWDADAKGITFHLRKDATFHDGTPVRAATSNGRSIVPYRLADSLPARWRREACSSRSNFRHLTIIRFASISSGQTH